MSDKNNLYYVQDADRPMHVLAPSWGAALAGWRAFVRQENKDDPVKEPIEPDGIALVAPSDEVVVVTVEADPVPSGVDARCSWKAPLPDGGRTNACILEAGHDGEHRVRVGEVGAAPPEIDRARCDDCRRYLPASVIKTCDECDSKLCEECCPPSRIPHPHSDMGTT